MNKKLSIILLNYNGYEDTINCVKSIQKSKNLKNYDIIVVDNKSPDDSLKYLRKVKDIILIESPSNDGFACGNNIGIKYALEHNSDYILLLNNDTEVDENAISIMLDKISNDDSLGIVECRIMYYSEKNKINYFGGHVDFTSCLAVHHHLNKEYKEGMEEKFFYTDFITGCSLMIKREVFEKVGLLPEEYFMYYEDTDFCVNVVDNGYKLGVCSDSVIYHKVSSSSGGQASPFSTKWATRNRILFMKKFKKKTKGLLTKFIFYSSRIPVALIYIFTGKFKLLKAMNEGIKEGRKIKI